MDLMPAARRMRREGDGDAATIDRRERCGLASGGSVGDVGG